MTLIALLPQTQAIETLLWEQFEGYFTCKLFFRLVFIISTSVSLSGHFQNACFNVSKWTIKVKKNNKIKFPPLCTPYLLQIVNVLFHCLSDNCREAGLVGRQCFYTQRHYLHLEQTTSSRTSQHRGRRVSEFNCTEVKNFPKLTCLDRLNIRSDMSCMELTRTPSWNAVNEKKKDAALRHQRDFI